MAEYKRGSIENCLPMRRIVRLFQSLIGGGGGRECKVYHDTAKMCHPIRIFHIRNIHIPSEKKNLYVGRYKTFICYLQLSRKPRSCSSQCEQTNWKPQETKQHHSTERDRNGNQLDALSSCNLRKKQKQMKNVAFFPFLMQEIFLWP